jgi:hypothetical protein
MIRNKKLLMLLGALTLPPAVLAGWYFGTGRRVDNGIKLVLSDAGYYQLTPPSRLFPPGTIGLVEKLRDGSYKLHLACNMNRADLAAMIETSPTVDKSFASRLTNAFNAQAEAVATAMTKASGDRVRSVDLKVNDMRIFTMSAENMGKVRDTYLKDQCEKAVIGNLLAGARVCQTAEVLQADVAYRMSYTEGLSTEQRAGLTKQLSAQADFGSDSSENDEVRGDDLYIGVKIDLTCFRLDAGKQRLAAGRLKDGA